MAKFHQRVLSALLVLALIVSGVPMTFAAKQEITVEKIPTQTVSNPLYEGLVEPSQATYADRYYAYSESSAEVEAKCTDDYEEIVSTLTEGMENRQSAISLYVASFVPLTGQWLGDLFEDALSETNVPTQGDYLRWVWNEYSARNPNALYSNKLDCYCYKFVFYVSYYTTKAQEDALTQEVTRVLNSFNFTSSTTSTQKVTTIYNYITKNVTYDYANLNNSNHLLKYTAYAALMNKTAVCQGYATLFYRMAEMAGVDTRVIVGDGGGPHAWNLTKIGTFYYYLDSTWDAGQTNYNYFLRGFYDFPDHINDPEYDTVEFYLDYPIAESRYTHNPAIDPDTIPLVFDQEDVSLEFTNVTYTGSPIKPKAIVYYDPNAALIYEEYPLTEGVDYKVYYYNNVQVGKATVVVMGIGRYEGSGAQLYFNIQPPISSLSAPKTVTAKLTAYNAATVSWSRVSGATHYRVYYRNTKKTEYKLLTTTTSLSYKKTGLTASSSYEFKIVPCLEQNGILEASAYKTVTISTAKNLSAPKTVTAKLYGYDDIKLTWSKVSGANAYRVYYRNSTKSAYTYKGITKTTSYKFPNLSDGAKYYFKVVPCTYVNGSYFTDDSYKVTTEVTLKKVSTPTVSKVNNGKVSVKWKNIAGESGYQISKSTSKSKTSIVATYATTTGTKKTVSATKGKTYYYKVRAYTVVDGKKIYGPWSSVKSYKLK